MSEVIYVKSVNPGMTAGLIACGLAVLGIITIGIVFVPLAFIVFIVGLLKAFGGGNISAIGVNILAFILIVVGLLTSPLLIGAIGLGTAVTTQGLESSVRTTETNTTMEYNSNVKIAPEQPSAL